MLKFPDGKGDASAPSKPEAKSAKANASPFAFLIGDDDVDDVSVKGYWHEQAGSTEATELFTSKLRVGMAQLHMEYAKRACPTYTDDDLIVVERKGVSEVWTMRAFKPREIVIPCISSDIRTGCWTKGNSHSIPVDGGPTNARPIVVDGKNLGIH